MYPLRVLVPLLVAADDDRAAGDGSAGAGAVRAEQTILISVAIVPRALQLQRPHLPHVDDYLWHVGVVSGCAAFSGEEGALVPRPLPLYDTTTGM